MEFAIGSQPVNATLFVFQYCMLWWYLVAIGNHQILLVRMF